MTDEDALSVVKHMKYEYFPKGTAIRRAGKETDRICFIMCGKVVCALPCREDDQKQSGNAGSSLNKMITDSSSFWKQRRDG